VVLENGIVIYSN